jgi:hypothetical protein
VGLMSNTDTRLPKLPVRLCHSPGVLHPREVPLGDPGATHAAAAGPVADRYVVLRRPLWPGGYCGHACVVTHRHTVDRTSLDGAMRVSLPSNVS